MDDIDPKAADAKLKDKASADQTKLSSSADELVKNGAKATQKHRAEHALIRQNSEKNTLVPALRRIGQSLLPEFRSVFEQLANCKIIMTAVEPEILSYGRWSEQQAELVSISQFSFPPMRGRFLLKMDADMISALVDAFFGGSMRTANHHKSEFGRSDLNLIERIGKNCCRLMNEGWQDYGHFRCAIDSHQDNIGALRYAKPDQRVVIQRFRLSPQEKVHFEFELIFSLDSLQSVSDMLADDDEPVVIDPLWQQQLAGSVNEIYLKARSILAQPTLSVAQLTDLKVGDILTISPARNLPMIIEDRIFAYGSIGERNGMAAFKISRFENKG